MKKRKSLTAIVVFFAICLAVYPVFSWFIQFRTSIMVATGDIKIEVNGWYQIALIDEELTYENELKDINIFDNISSNYNICFKFKIKNASDRNGELSMRFSDFSKIIFENFLDYRQAKINQTPLSSELINAIDTASEANTAKLAMLLSDVYYENSGVKTRMLDDEMFLWKYSAGEKFIQKVALPANNSVYVYLTFKNSQSTISVESYKNSLCGYTDENGNKVIGYGQEYCANLLKYSWDALSDTDKQIVDDYLKYFNDCEVDSISSSEENALLTLNLNLKYFEFIAENSPNR